MNRFFTKYWLLVTLLGINAIFFTLISIILDFRFEENDDVMMCLIANGNYSGLPDCHLVFQNALLGSLLSSLYRLTTSVEWYSLFLSITHVVAISIITYKIIQRWKDNIILLIFFLIGIYTLWSVTIQSFQFTTTSGLICVAGCMLLCDANNALWGGYLAILMSALIRYEATILVLLLFLPLAVLTYKNQWRKYTIVFGAFTLVLLAVFANKMFYDTPEWEYYYEYNDIRGEINDNANLNAITDEDIYAMGIKKEDYEMLCGFMPDPQFMTLPILKRIHHCLKDVPLKDKVLNINQLIKYRIPLVILLFITLLVVFSVGNKYDKYMIALWFVMCLLLLSVLCLEHTLKNRVFLCALIALVSFFTQISNVHPKQMWLNIVIGICFFALSAKYGYQCVKVHASIEKKMYSWQGQQPLLQTLSPDSYVVALSQLSLEAIPPYHIKDFHNRLYPLGWLTAIPLTENQVKSHADLTNSNVYIFMNKDMSISRIVDYLESRYDIHCTIDCITQNEEYRIVQLKNIIL